MTYVRTKKELKEALKRKDPDIIVTGKLCKKLKGFVKLKSLSKSQMTTLVAFATGAGAAYVAAIATAVPSGGLSVAGASFALLAAAPAAGVSTSTVIILVVLLGVIGLSAIALLKDYNVILDINEKDGIHFQAKKDPQNTQK